MIEIPQDIPQSCDPYAPDYVRYIVAQHIDGRWGIVDRRTGAWLPEPSPGRYRFATWGAALAAIDDLVRSRPA